jgi:hypothetical protein
MLNPYRATATWCPTTMIMVIGLTVTWVIRRGDSVSGMEVLIMAATAMEAIMAGTTAAITVAVFTGEAFMEAVAGTGDGPAHKIL